MATVLRIPTGRPPRRRSSSSSGAQKEVYWFRQGHKKYRIIPPGRSECVALATGECVCEPRPPAADDVGGGRCTGRMDWMPRCCCCCCCPSLPRRAAMARARPLLRLVACAATASLAGFLLGFYQQVHIELFGHGCLANLLEGSLCLVRNSS